MGFEFAGNASHTLEGAPIAGASESGAAPRRILVTDDEPIIRIAVRRMLKRHGWDVTEAGSGAEAIQLLESGDGALFDAVLCDQRMPGMTGIQVYRRLQETRPDLLDRFVMATGDSVDGPVEEFLTTSGCRVLNKPFSMDALLGLLRELA